MFTAAIPYTQLNELELVNTLRRGVGDKAITHGTYTLVMRELNNDEADGLIVRSTLNPVKLHEKALELARKHTANVGCRSLDILHVASALLLGAQNFASFDLKQRKLAQAVRLAQVPALF